MDMSDDIDDEQVWDIAREKAMMAPERIKLVTEYILDNFDRKTYRGDKTYIYNALTNIKEVASGKAGTVEEIKQKQRISGFNSILQLHLFLWLNCIIRNLKTNGSRSNQETTCCYYF